MLAGLLAQGNDVVPIPGTRRSERVAENARAADINLSRADLAAISAVAGRASWAGNRQSFAAFHTETPPDLTSVQLFPTNYIRPTFARQIIRRRTPPHFGGVFGVQAIVKMKRAGMGNDLLFKRPRRIPQAQGVVSKFRECNKIFV